MREADHLRAQAAKCRRIAADQREDPTMAEDLHLLARDYEERAERVTARERDPR